MSQADSLRHIADLYDKLEARSEAIERCAREFLEFPAFKMGSGDVVIWYAAYRKAQDALRAALAGKETP